MSDRLKALREERSRIVTEMRGITDKAETEKRDLTNEESEQHSKLFDQSEAKRNSIVAIERQVEADRDEATRQAEDEETEKRTRDAGGGEGTEAEKRQLEVFRKYLRSGQGGLSETELRELQAGSATEGGYLLAPQQFLAQLIKGLDNKVFIRAKATKFQVAAASSLGAPSLDADMDDFDWTTELKTGNQDDALRFGKRELRPHPMAKRVKVSKTLLRASALPIDAIVRDRGVYKLGVTQEKGYMTGNGDKKPLGLFVASDSGIPTSRDVSTGNTSTDVTFDGVIEAKYSLKAEYWSAAEWLWHRDAVKKLTKIKDSEGQYIWRESVRAGEADMLLGRPINVSEYVPNTFTTGQYVGLFGDMSYYWIADALELQIQRLVELYAESNQDGFIFRYEGDGMPVLGEAFARVKLG